MTNTGKLSNTFLGLMLFLIVAVGLFATHATPLHITVDQVKSHAVLRHGPEEAAAVRDCVSDPSLKQYRLIVRDSKYIDACDSFSFFGFQVMLRYGGSSNTSKWSELTAYLRDGIKSLSDLEDFADKNGLELFERIGTGPEAQLIKIP